MTQLDHCVTLWPHISQNEPTSHKFLSQSSYFKWWPKIFLVVIMKWPTRHWQTLPDKLLDPFPLNNGWAPLSMLGATTSFLWHVVGWELGTRHAPNSEAIQWAKFSQVMFCLCVGKLPTETKPFLLCLRVPSPETQCPTDEAALCPIKVLPLEKHHCSLVALPISETTLIWVAASQGTPSAEQSNLRNWFKGLCLQSMFFFFYNGPSEIRVQLDFSFDLKCKGCLFAFCMYDLFPCNKSLLMLLNNNGHVLF